MDPNEALQQMREAITEVHTIEDTLDGPHPTAEATFKLATMASILALHAEALDEWMTRGGFRPTAWAT